jgi:ABC-2 type transport system permease protein
MRLWWEVARRGFRRYATYRWATVAGVTTNSVFGFIRAYVFIAMFAAIRTAGGYSLIDALTYTFVTQALLMPLYLWGWFEVADGVSSGQIATDLYRPMDYQLYWLAQDIGRATYHAFLRGIPPFVVGAIFFTMRVPTSPVTWLAFVVSCYLAVAVSFGLRFIVNLTAFWVINQRGIQSVATAAWTLFSGFIIPIAFFPDTARHVIELMPFIAMLELPLNIFLQRATGIDVLGTLLWQAAWVVALLFAGRVMLRAGTRKLVVQGG